MPVAPVLMQPPLRRVKGRTKMDKISDLGGTADEHYRKIDDALAIVFKKSGSVFNDEALAALLVYFSVLRQALGMKGNVTP